MHHGGFYDPKKKKDVGDEIKRIDHLIQKEYNRRKKLFDKIGDLDSKIWNTSGGVHRFLATNGHFTKNFLKYLKEKNVERKYRKTLKRIVRYSWVHDYHKHQITKNKKRWKSVEESLNIVLKYADDYLLWEKKKELCRLTDCYKKLSTHEKCVVCGNELRKGSIFCDRCGKKIGG